MRRLPLLLAMGALWLFLAAIPALADGGPHVAATNNGSVVLTSDTCAGCHRIHTGRGEYLIVQNSVENLCLSCHGPDVAGATTNVVSGVQYRPETTYPSPVRDGGGTDANGVQLGALRAGGFVEARLGQPIRLSSGTSLKTEVPPGPAEATTSAHMHLTAEGYTGIAGTDIAWGNGVNGSGVGPTVELECTSCHNPHGNGMYRILNPLPQASGLSAAVVDPVVLDVASTNATADTIITKLGHPYQIGDLVTLTGVTGIANGTYTVVNVPDGTKFQVNTTLTDWTVAVFDITPSGTTGTVQRASAPVADSPVGAVDVNGYPVNTKNYTVIQRLGTQGTDSTYLLYANQVAGTYTSSQGDYFHRTVPFVAATTADDAPNGQPSTSVSLGEVAFNTQITAWCSTCHTRYESFQNPNPTGTEAGSSAPSSRIILGTANGTRLITTTASHGFVIGDVVTVTGNANIGANGQYTVETVPSSTTFTLTGVTPANSPAAVTITGANTGTEAFTAVAHGLAPGDTVTIAGASSSTGSKYTPVGGSATSVNGTWTVATTPTVDTFTVYVTGTTVMDITTAGTAAWGTVTKDIGTVIRFSAPQTQPSWWFPRVTSNVPVAGVLPTDPIFQYQHRTLPSNRACTTCHVAHGTNAAMTGANSSTVLLPNGTPSASSRLLKIDNRGTCQACHDPTSTFGSNNFNSYQAAAPVAIVSITASTGNIVALTHGLAKGDVVKITGTTGSTTALDGIYIVLTVVDGNNVIVTTSGAPGPTAAKPTGDATGGTITKIADDMVVTLP